MSARGFTKSVMDGRFTPLQQAGMLSKAALLRQVEDAAASRAEIARVLKVAPARITEMFKGERDLSFEEGRALINHYRLEGAQGGEVAELPPGITMIEEVDLALGMGGGTFAELAESKGFVPFKDDWLSGLHRGARSTLRVARGRGDSMQPTILDGDMVMIDMSQATVLDQDLIWAVFWGDLGMIKRVRRQPGGTYLLMSDNPAVSPITAVDGELHVLGRVIWIGRRM